MRTVYTLNYLLTTETLVLSTVDYPPPSNRGIQSLNKLPKIIKLRKRESWDFNPKGLESRMQATLNCLSKSLKGLNEVMDIKNLAWCVQGSKHLMDFSLVVLKILSVTNLFKLICPLKYSERTILIYMTKNWVKWGQQDSISLSIPCSAFLPFGYIFRQAAAL